MKLLCQIGIHKWSKWSDQQKVYGTVGDKSLFVGYYQMRRCEKCNAIKVRTNKF